MLMEALNSVFETIGDFLANGFSIIFDLITSLFHGFFGLFSDFISYVSSELSALGSYFISIFDFSSFSTDFTSIDFLYVFVGVLLSVFVFKLLWNLICSFF